MAVVPIMVKSSSSMSATIIVKPPSLFSGLIIVSEIFLIVFYLTVWLDLLDGLSLYVSRFYFKLKQFPEIPIRKRSGNMILNERPGIQRLPGKRIAASAQDADPYLTDLNFLGIIQIRIVDPNIHGTVVICIQSKSKLKIFNVLGNRSGHTGWLLVSYQRVACKTVSYRNKLCCAEKSD